MMRRRQVQLPFDPRRGIPASEISRLRDLGRRTKALRLGAAFLLVAALALAFLVARAEHVRNAPLVPAGTTGMLVLDLSSSVYEGALDQTVQKLSETDERIGLVVFSDAAYEMLPPGAPSKELISLLRYFQARPDATLPLNPWEEFRGGTRMSEGLRVARLALLREGVDSGSILLVSDLEILPDEIARVGEILALIRGDGISIRIVPLFPSLEKRALIEQLVGSDSFLAEPDPEAEAVRAPDERRLATAAPWVFLLAAALLVGLVSANEVALPRLETRR